MRLSEERIVDLSEKIVDGLLDNGLIDSGLNENELINIIKKTIWDDLTIEDEIELEAKRVIGTYSRSIPEGSAEYNAVFQTVKEDIAKRKNYVL